MSSYEGANDCIRAHLYGTWRKRRMGRVGRLDCGVTGAWMLSPRSAGPVHAAVSSQCLTGLRNSAWRTQPTRSRLGAGGAVVQDYAKVGVEDLADKQKLFRLIKRVNSEAERGGGWDSPVAASPRKAAASPAPKVATPVTSTPLQPSNKADILDLEGMDDETDLLGEVSAEHT